MKRLVIALMLLVSTGCAAASSDYDEAATASLKSEVDVILKAVDSGSFSEMLAKMDDDVLVFDLDDKNQPVRFEGIAAVRKYMEGMEASLKAQNAKFSSTIGSNACHATKVMGFCALEFDQTMTVGGQTQGPFKFRGTLVARKVGDAWKWVHWHGSFAELPKTS